MRVSLPILAIALALCQLSPAGAWTATTTSPSRVAPSKTPTLYAGGFGGSSNNKKDIAAEQKLKPKAQWDRFLNTCKGAARVRVAVRTTATADWIEVGHVKSVDNAYTALAVARQRALIAEVRAYIYVCDVCGGWHGTHVTHLGLTSL